MHRPDYLFPLFASLATLEGIGKRIETRFKALEIEKPRDLLFHLPAGLIERTPVASIFGLEAGSFATVEVLVGKHQIPRKSTMPYRIFVSDSECDFQLVFFRQVKSFRDFLTAELPSGQRRVISGRLELFDGVLQMTHPDFITLPEGGEKIPKTQPIYPTTVGLSQKMIAKAVQASIARAPEVDEWIDPHQIAKTGWPDWRTALSSAHAPESMRALSPMDKARTRLAYDEFFAHQLMLARARESQKIRPGRASIATGVLTAKVTQAIPYTLTAAQKRTVAEIAADLASDIRMNRLLQGDVGAGKTLVAFLALLHVIEAGGQGALMAPTEILARQHLQVLRPLAACVGIIIESLTRRDNGRLRDAKLSDLKNGKIHILVGTHALFQEDVIFHDLRLAVIDEQHRFGVRQRFMLGEKGAFVDILVMTATPIPRSLSIVHYGDMEVSLLDEKPPGRQPVKTVLISIERLDEVAQRLSAVIKRGEQAYWVCPLVKDSERSDLSAATSRFESLRTMLGEGVVGLVHGQMNAAEKDAAMCAFKEGKTKILVATTAIEVGVDMPNAVIMIVERADHFGLAQIHQLRGRVGRGAQTAHCLLLYRAPLTQSARKRLELLRKTDDGFRIAEEDLLMRGAGDVLGTAQSGLPHFRIGDIQSQTSLLAIAQSDARKLLNDDPDFRSKRGKAAKILLAIMEQNRSAELISMG